VTKRITERHRRGGDFLTQLRRRSPVVEECGELFTDPQGNGCRCTLLRHHRRAHKGEVLISRTH
jgi:hypothetical protein